MCMALVGLCASAQEKGDMAAGLNIGVAPSLESGASVTNFGIGAKFQYNVTDPIRLEAAFDYGFKNKGVDVMTLGVNAHYIFKIGDKINLYPLVGIGYAHLGGGVSSDDYDYDSGFDYDYNYSYLRDYGYDDYDWSNSSDYEGEESSSSASKFFFNVGVGAEYALSSNLSVGAEIKYQYIKDFNRMPINIGVTYRF